MAIIKYVNDQSVISPIRRVFVGKASSKYGSIDPDVNGRNVSPQSSFKVF